MMRRRGHARPRAARGTAAAATLVVALCAACDGGIAPLAPEGPDAATIVARVDPNRYCDTAEVVDVVFRATALGCLAGDPDCELQDPEDGTQLTCPVADVTAVFAVQVTQPGRYRVAAVIRRPSGADTLECFADAGGSQAFTVQRAQIDDRTEIEAMDGVADCVEN